MEEVQFAGAVSTSDPYNYRQAIQADDSERWKEATLAEYNTLLQNGTWEIVDLPPGEKAIGSSWVFRNLNVILTALLNATRPESSPKAALNVPGRDYLEVHAPTPRPATIRTTFCHSCCSKTLNCALWTSLLLSPMET